MKRKVTENGKIKIKQVSQVQHMKGEVGVITAKTEIDLREK